MKIGTHNGTFHTDEILATAILDTLYGPLVIIRTRDIPTLEACDLVIDVGGKYDGVKFFDHHQADFQASRQHSDVPYASSGLVWLHYGMLILEDMYPGLTSKQLADVATVIDNKYIQPVDAIDTGFVRPSANTYHFSQFVSTFNSSDVNNDLMQLQKFHMALDAVRSWLFSVISTEVQNLQEQQKVQDIMSRTSDGILVLPSYLPWQDVVLPHNKVCSPENKLTHVVFPSGDSWRVQATDAMYYLPVSWRGLSGTELVKASNIDGAIFCHKAGFIAGFTTADQAIKAAQLSLT